jgi:SAM-dependent methyltransferase
MAKSGPLEIIEGFYLAHVINHFYQNGVLGRLTGERDASEIAGEFGYDLELFEALLDFAYQSTDILLRNRAGRYLLNPKYEHYYSLGFQFDKFIGSYGPALVQLEQSLRSKTLGRQLVNRKVEARAYHTIGSPPNPLVSEVIRELKLHSLLDLGCGPATLLTELCEADPTFRAWGIDESAAMCKVARERVARAKLSERIRIVHADARNLGTHLRPQVRQRIEALQSKGLFNELFRYGNEEAIKYLLRLKKWFPGRLLFIVDYYGKLTHVPNVAAKYRHTLIHDVIQVITAQGIPPSDLAGWRAVYEAADCSLEHAFEGDSQGIEWFVHLLRL